MRYSDGTEGSRRREVREGWTGRRRWYRCRVCGDKFLHDGFRLPENARICGACLTVPANREMFDAAFEERVCVK